MKRFLYFLIFLTVTGIILLAASEYDFTRPGPLDQPATLLFPPNTHFLSIADTLADAQVIRLAPLFKLQAFLRGESTHFKAGEYYFPEHISAFDAAHLLAAGKTVVHHLTVPEGLSTAEIVTLVQSDSMLEGAITLDIREGELLPQTYNFSRGDKRNEVIARMQRAMRKTLDAAWQTRMDGLPFATPLQALTLASIVEKETGLASERPRVAAVYINRLKKNMLLQADPTTAYAVTGGKYKLTRPLTLADLQINSPYNTYRSAGLPPGPIANPGTASIAATLHPASSDELYFVATGVGGHNFARTEAEHNENVRKYRALRH